MRISEAASISGTSPRSLRYSEDQGLIVPGRTEGGYRDYCAGTVDRVLTIRSLLDSGLPVRLIRRVLQETQGQHVTDEELLRDVQRYRDRLSTRIAALREQEDALDAYLDELESRVDGG